MIQNNIQIFFQKNNSGEQYIVSENYYIYAEISSEEMFKFIVYMLSDDEIIFKVSFLILLSMLL